MPTACGPAAGPAPAPLAQTGSSASLASQGSLGAAPAPSSEGTPRLPIGGTLAKKSLEHTLSHAGSGIHVEWYHPLRRTESEHVQLSMGEPPAAATPEKPAGGGGRAWRSPRAQQPRPQPHAPAAARGGEEGEEGEPACCRGTLANGEAYVRLAVWLALLFAGYGVQRGLCAAGLPYDCDAVDAADVYETLTSLAFVGGALGWLAGVTRPARFAWLFHWRRAYLWAAYAGLLPAYSAIATLPAFHDSLNNLAGWSATAIAVVSVVAALVVASLAFHIWLATYPLPEAPGCCCGAAAAPGTPAEPGSPAGSSRGSEAGGVSADAASLSGGSEAKLSEGSGAAPAKAAPRAGPPRRRRRRCLRTLRRYLAPRGAILLYFIVWFATLAGSGAFDLHLHHYALGWALGSLAAFNHPVSGVQLALGTAVFVQGAASYGFDPLFTPAGNSTGGCLNVTSPSTGQMTCAFWSAQPFNLSFCSQTNWVPWFDCSVEWPFPNTRITKKMLRTRDLADLPAAPPPIQLTSSTLVPLVAPFG